MSRYNSCFFTSLILIFFLGAAAGAAEFEPFGPDFERPWLRIDTIPKSADDQIFFDKVIQWNPSGAGKIHPLPCTADDLKVQMQEAHGNTALLFRSLQNYFGRCDKILSRSGPGPQMALIELSTAKYKFRDNHFLRGVSFILKDGTVRRGLLALKNSPEPRPLIVAVQGVCENRYDLGARLFLMHLFDAGPFNVLILANSTGSDFIHDNKRFLVGGLDDGREISQIVELLSGADSPLKGLISSIHLAGESLGAHSALYASLYLGSQARSVQAYCPVVNLKESVEAVLKSNLLGKQACGDILQVTQMALGQGPSATGEQFGSLAKSDMAFPYFQKNNPEPLPPPFDQARISTLEDFWKFNRFENFFTRSKVPTLLWAASDDPVVPPQSNSLSLKTAAEKVGFSGLGILEVNKGSHCAFDVDYGMDVVNTVADEFILSFSPEFDVQGRRDSLAFSQLKIPKNLFSLDPGEKFFGARWSVPENKTDANLTLKIWSPDLDHAGPPCDSTDPYDGDSRCFREVVVHVPLKDLHFQFKYPVSTDTEKGMYGRWLNTRIKVLNRLGQSMIDTVEKPDHLEWYRD